MTAVLILNVVLAALVVTGIVGMLAWSIVRSQTESIAVARPARQPRTKRARARVGLAVENHA
jgi:Flp pilus assembly protein CpaB